MHQSRSRRKPLPIAGPGPGVLTRRATSIRAATERAIAANRKRGIGTTQLLVNDTTGLPRQPRNFIRVFGLVHARAIADGHAALAGLQFREMRRTCVVRLGLNDAQISAISGHQLETTKRILETYMPREIDMAASAIVATLGGAGGMRVSARKSA